VKTRLLAPLTALLVLAAMLLYPIGWDGIEPAGAPEANADDEAGGSTPISAPDNPGGARSEAAVDFGTDPSNLDVVETPARLAPPRAETGTRLVVHFDLPPNATVHDFVLRVRSPNMETREATLTTGGQLKEEEGVRYVNFALPLEQSVFIELQSWDDVWRSDETTRRFERDTVPDSLTCLLTQTAVVDVYAKEAGGAALPDWTLGCEFLSPNAGAPTQVLQENGEVSTFLWPIVVETIMSGAGRRVTRLLPGPYRFAAHSPRHTREVREPVLNGGEREALRFELAALPIGGDIKGTLRRASGRPKDPEGKTLVSNTILVRSTGADHLEFRTKVNWSSQGSGFVGTWRVDDVPVGSYHVRLLSEGWSRIEPAAHQVVPPSAQVNFVVMDTAGFKDIGFDVLSQSTSEPLAGARAVFHLTHGGTAQSAATPGEAVQWNVPEDTPVTWDLSLDGYEKLSGTIQDFTHARAIGEGVAWFARVELIPTE